MGPNLLNTGRGPSVVISSDDVTAVKAAIIAETASEHFTLDNSFDHEVTVSRRLSPVKVLLLAQTVPTDDSREILHFELEPANANIRVHVARVERMLVAGGQYNEDAILNTQQYRALETLLAAVKLRVEGSEQRASGAGK
jgi:hypothetical protein